MKKDADKSQENAEMISQTRIQDGGGSLSYQKLPDGKDKRRSGMGF